jgi:hypothetical protein
MLGSFEQLVREVSCVGCTMDGLVLSFYKVTRVA